MPTRKLVLSLAGR